MLDQSYSYENFRIILDVENRKGKYLENSSFFDDGNLFEKSRTVIKEIVEINESIRNENKRLRFRRDRESIDYTVLNTLEQRKSDLLIERESELKIALTKITDKVNHSNFKIAISKGAIKFGKQLFVTDDTAENYFVQKQLQRNINKTFNVKQSNRKQVISQIKLLLSDNFPKIVIRTDLSEFYESIPHKQLIEKIEENSILNYPSKKIIKDILNPYWNIQILDGLKQKSDNRVGLPRGIGISAFLSELYLKDFDKRLRSLPNVTFYARYVDDIIIIITPTQRTDQFTTRYFKTELGNIASLFMLKINDSKTQIIDLCKLTKERKVQKKYSLDFLGYQFRIGFIKDINDGMIKSVPLIVGMSDKKKARFKEKINIAFLQFMDDVVKYQTRESKSNTKLLQRVKVLTNNFRLYRRKQNVLIGIYFSNEYLTDDLEDLYVLDGYLKTKINSVSSTLSPRTKHNLERLSFVQGFKNKVTLNFNFNGRDKRGVVKIDKILKIWANLQ